MLVVFVGVVCDALKGADEELLVGVAVCALAYVGIVPVVPVVFQVDGRTGGDFSVSDALVLWCVDPQHAMRIDGTSVHLVGGGIAETNVRLKRT